MILEYIIYWYISIQLYFLPFQNVLFWACYHICIRSRRDGRVKRESLWMPCSVSSLHIALFLMFLSDIIRHSVITKPSLGKIRHFTKYVHYSIYKFHLPFIHSFCHVFINSTPLVIILYVPATPKLCKPIKLIACNYLKYTVGTCFLESSPHPQVTNIRTVSLTNYVSYPILTCTSNTIRRKQSPAVFPTKNTYVDSAIRFLTT